MPLSKDQTTIPAGSPSRPSSSLPPPSTATATGKAPTKRSSSTSDSLEESPREDSGGAGNESDDEREPSGSGGQTTREDSDEQVARLPHHEMYPFPSTSHHQFQRHSSAEVEASSAGSLSSDMSSAEDDDELDGDQDVEMKDTKPVALPKRTLSEYRASLSRVGLAAPPKIRRLGALGISVHSDSDIENPRVSGIDTNDRIDPASGGDTSAGTRETDLGVSFAALQRGSGSGSPGDGTKSTRKRKRGVADATFRGIVDELAIENRQLKDKLRRYEAHGVPTELKDSRLFEIRFYDGLPIDQRTELESFLTTYVKEFVERTPLPPPPSSSPRTSKTPRRPAPHRDVPVVPDPSHATHAEVGCTSLPSPQQSEPSDTKLGPDALPVPDSSNSGLEPFSISGVGSGVYRPTGDSFPEPARAFSHPASLPLPAILTEQDRELAKSVVTSLEQLFRRSLRQNKEEIPQEETAQRSRSNETYMANFLSHDFLSDGWVYLNLASTMAELHRYSVTLNFVQQAVRNHSTNLEVSGDGKRIRWTGPSPSPSPPPSLPTTSKASNIGAETASRRVVKIASPAPTDSHASSSGGVTTTTRGSMSSNDPSSSENMKGSQLANSIAPTASTAPTSQAPSRGTKAGESQNAKPQRPTAAVLQRMDRLSPPTDVPQNATPNDGHRVSPKRVRTTHKLTDPQPALSFVAHPDSALRKSPAIYHRLLRNKDEDDVDFGMEHLARPGQAVPKDPGMLVFYANGHFCSDLTQEEAKPAEVATDRSFLLGGFDDQLEAESDFSDSLDSMIDLDDEVDLLDLHLGSQDGNTSGEEEGTVDSQASSLLRMNVSGMTTTSPADLFTVLVKINHPSKRTRAQSVEPHGSKKRRLASERPRIVSSKAYQHRPLMTKRVRAINIDFDESSSGDEAGRPHLTVSNLAKHDHPTLAAITPPLDEDAPGFIPDATPSPPHDDYLLSLAAPLHAWAPRETNFVSQSPPVPPRPDHKNRNSLHRRLARPARTMSEMSTTTGDERPISLDDPVGPGLVR